MKLSISEITKPESPVRLFLTFLIPFVIVLSILFFSILLWAKKSHDENLASILKENAVTLFNQIIITRLWNAQHGGVYVEVTPDTPPNPYLEDPRRDIISIDGRHYTKINPAYMTRQLSEITMQKQGYKFRIISLNPVNPLNVPDDWERKALKKFETNEKVIENGEILQYNGERVFRYIAPLKTETPCLKCHARHGYSYGDIRGGISIIMPMERYDSLHSMGFRKTIISLLAMASLSIIFVVVVTFIASKKISFAIEKDIEKEKLSAILEMAGATAHEMRQPLTIVSSFIDLFKQKIRQGESLPDEDIEIISSQCERMDNIIKKMLNITEYRTKDYIMGTKIIDFAESSKNTSRKEGNEKG